MTVDLGGKWHRIVGHYNVFFKDIHTFPNAYGTSENEFASTRCWKINILSFSFLKKSLYIPNGHTTQ